MALSPELTRSPRPWNFLTVALALSVLAAGCDTPLVGPLAPSSTPVPTPAPGMPSDSAGAKLVVSAFDVTFELAKDGYLYYLPSAVVRETGGSSPARITRLFFAPSGGGGWGIRVAEDTPLGQGCLLTPESRVVPAGGTWTTAFVYRYCLGLDSDTDIAGKPVTFTIDYVGDDGVPGSATATATVR